MKPKNCITTEYSASAVIKVLGRLATGYTLREYDENQLPVFATEPNRFGKRKVLRIVPGTGRAMHIVEDTEEAKDLG